MAFDLRCHARAALRIGLWPMQHLSPPPAQTECHRTSFGGTGLEGVDPTGKNWCGAPPAARKTENPAGGEQQAART